MFGLSELESALQQTAQDIQSLRQQTANIASQLREFQTTVEALEEQADDKAVYRQIGGVLLEVSDRKSLKLELEQSIETLSEHLERLGSKERELRQVYDELVKSVEESA